MASRLPQPKLQNTASGEHRLVADCRAEAMGYRMTVKRGFLTDGESSPRAAWTLFGHPFDPESLPQAVPHDALYQSGVLPRRTADRIWLAIAEANGMGPIERRVKYACLRAWGWAVWSKARRNAEGERFARRHLVLELLT